MQGSTELFPKILDLLISPATSIAAIYFYDRFVARKRDGFPLKELMAQIDLSMTEHFDQLRRDLSTTIEKSCENSIMRYMWEMERGGRRKTDS